MKKLLLLLSILFLSSFYSDHSLAQEVSFNGQASVWTAITEKWKAGITYIPQLRIAHPLAEGQNLDAEISLNSYTWAWLDTPEDFEDNARLKLYRAWLRYAIPQLELRLGLQRINFGPAKILRTDKLELGGRFQYPVPRGEIALSVDQRFVEQEDCRKKTTVRMQDGVARAQNSSSNP